MRQGLIGAFFFLALCSPAFGQAKADPSQVLTRFLAMKPADQHFEWKQIPWETDLEKGLAIAKKENRPLFLWGSDDDPLDRC